MKSHGCEKGASGGDPGAQVSSLCLEVQGQASDKDIKNKGKNPKQSHIRNTKSHCIIKLG